MDLLNLVSDFMLESYLLAHRCWKYIEIHSIVDASFETNLWQLRRQREDIVHSQRKQV